LAVLSVVPFGAAEKGELSAMFAIAHSARASSVPRVSTAVALRR
jgi:hypothetical protein